MRLYLVQHGDAVPKDADPERPLTEQGRQDVARVAALVQEAGFQVDQIRHSGKRRAEETAAILAEHLQPAQGFVASPGLGPQDDVRPTAKLLDQEPRTLMLVGHRPFLDQLAGLLIAGDPGRSTVQFAKGGIVCLERAPSSLYWSVSWAVTPELLR